MQSRRNRRGSAEPLKTNVTLLPQGRVRIEISDAAEDTGTRQSTTRSAPADGGGSALREVLFLIGVTAARLDNVALVEQYLPLVRRVAYRLVRRLPRHIHVDDLIAAGYEGLLEAISRFDPARARRLDQFAEYRIRGAMLDVLRGLDPLGRDTRARANRVDEVVHRLSQKLGRAPEQAEIVEEMGMQVEGYHRLRLVISSTFALSLEVLSEDEAAVPADKETPSPSDVVEFAEMRRHVSDAIKCLPERQRLVLTLYYYEGLTLREIGEILKVTESRACQIHAEGMQQLRRIFPPEGES